VTILGAHENGLLIIGAGGHALSILDFLLEIAGGQVLGLVDRSAGATQARIMGLPVWGEEEALGRFASKKRPALIMGVGCTESDLGRWVLYNSLKEKGFSFCTVIAPSAVVSARSELGEGSVIMRLAMVGTGARLGEAGIINTAAVVEHDCRLGSNVHVASRATLLGRVESGDHVLFGAGCVVRQQVKISSRVTIGAGSVVLEDLPPGSVCYGNPCKVRRKI